MAVQEGLGGFPRIGLHEAGIRLRQIQAEEVDLLANAADHCQRLPEIHLAVARRVGQRHERLPCSRPADPHVIASPRCSRRESHARPAASRKSSWPSARCFIGASRSASRIASITGSSDPSFGFSGGFVRVYPGGQRELAHLQHRLAVQSEDPGGLPAAVTLDEHEFPNGGIDLHDEHPRPPKSGSLSTGRILLRPRQHFAGASVALLCHRPTQIVAALVGF